MNENDFTLGISTDRAYFFPRYSDFDASVLYTTRRLISIVAAHQPDKVIIDLSHQSFVFPVRQALLSLNWVDAVIYSPFIGVLDSSIISTNEQRVLEEELLSLAKERKVVYVGDKSELEDVLKVTSGRFIEKTRYAQTCRDECRRIVKEMSTKMEIISQ